MIAAAEMIVVSVIENPHCKEGVMAKGQLGKGHSNKAKLTPKEKAKKKAEKRAKAGKV